MRRVLKARASALALASGVVGLLMISSPIVKAAPVRPVEYTWTLAALGQGGWIGGPLLEDGTVGGGGALSINNGQVVARFIPTTWTEDDDELISVCFDVVPIKPKGAPASSMCTEPSEATGTPIHIELFGDPHIFRITENH